MTLVTILVVCVLLLAAPPTYAQSTTTIGIHGSGTTNPAQCYRYIMEQFETQTKLPVKMTYRAVGTSTGQVEFFGDGTVSDNDFGSGDIPLNGNVFDSFQPGSVVHFPVLLNTYGFYHSLPVDELRLSPCLLARIFSREITDWNHPDILEINPQLKILNPFPITVARRNLGSSSTAIVTEYLQRSCPSSWPESFVGTMIEWNVDTLACSESSGMVDCILGTPGTIGYLAGGVALGFDESIREVTVQNFDGNFLTSSQARSRGGVLVAIENSGILPSLENNFANVNLLNQPGEETWPMVSMTYIYVKKDLTFLERPDRQTLLKAFLRALYTEEYVSMCEEEFGFVPIAGPLRDIALSTIDSLVVSAGAPEWAFEFSTDRRLGQLDYVISTKRLSYAQAVQNDLVASVDLIREDIAALTGATPSTPTSPPVSPPTSTPALISGPNSTVLREVDELEQEIATLRTQTQDLTRDVENLQTETDILKAENMGMSEMVQDLLNGLVNVTTTNAEMMLRIAELEILVNDHEHAAEEDTVSLAVDSFSQSVFWVQVVLSMSLCWSLLAF